MKRNTDDVVSIIHETPELLAFQGDSLGVAASKTYVSIEKTVYEEMSENIGKMFSVLDNNLCFLLRSTLKENYLLKKPL